jgi:hypothetical protein
VQSDGTSSSKLIHILIFHFDRDPDKAFGSISVWSCFSYSTKEEIILSHDLDQDTSQEELWIRHNVADP